VAELLQERKIAVMAVDLDAYFNKISKLRMVHRVLIFTGTLVLLMGLFIYLKVMPSTAEIKTIKTDLKSMQGQITIAKINMRNLEKLETELARAQQDLTSAVRLLPTTSEIPSLLKNITRLGSESNLEFLLFSPEKEIARELYVEIPVSMEVRGGYHDVAMFFDKIGKMDRIVNVANVSMTPLQTQSTNLKTTCKVVTYRFKEEEKAEGADKEKK